MNAGVRTCQIRTSDVDRLESTHNHQCTTAFKVIPQELQFYKKMNLPLPRLCPNCRHYERLKQRNPLKLWHRKCMCEGQMAPQQNKFATGQANRLATRGLAKPDKSQIVYTNTAQHFHSSAHCRNEFETSYAPDRPEIVYCESCYNSEIV